MIRELQDGDMTSLLKYGEYFWQKSPFSTAGVGYNPKSVEELLLDMDKNHYLRLCEADGKVVGFLGVMLAPFHFNTNYTIGVELFFFVDPLYRGIIGAEMIAQAERDLTGEVDILAFGDMRSSKDMDEYYTSRGYALTERTFTKVL